MLESIYGFRDPETPIFRQKSLLRRVSLRIQPPQPSHPGHNLAKAFAWTCEAMLKDLDPKENTLDTYKVSFCKSCNAYCLWRIDLFLKHNLVVPGVPNRFPKDHVLIDQFIYWSYLFHNEAPRRIVRRKPFKAPGLFASEKKRSRFREKCVHQSQSFR